MPELPEVETVRQTLLNQIKGETIKNIKVIYSKILENTSVDVFTRKLIGQKLQDILRYGKYLIFIFDSVSVISHLRMEGKFFIKNNNDLIELHEHIIFEFESTRQLRYHDTRKFGKMVLLETTDFSEIMKYPSLGKLGPEANTIIDAKYFYDKVSKLKTPIKTVLLDQTIISGIGNIYADEICYLSKLHPLTLACNLTIKDAENIVKNSKIVLDEAILCGGTTIRSYTSSLGVTGRFQQKLHVHSREAEECGECKTKIRKIFVGGRGTYYCSSCQENKNIKIIGLTGIIASGKSSVVDYLLKLGYDVIDTDVLSRTLTTDYSKTLDDIMNKLKTYNEDKVNSVYQNGKLNRGLFRKLLFEDETFKNDYQSIIHPLIKKGVLKGLKTIKDDIIKYNKKRVVFLDVPLLYEASFDELCDMAIIVNANIDVIYERLRIRNNFSDSEIESVLKNQLSFEEKTKRALYNLKNKGQLYDVIDNSYTIEELYKKIDEYLLKI